MSTPELINDTTVRTRNANLVGVSNTVLSNDVRLQVWDDYIRDTEDCPVRLADVRLTVSQALSIIARLTIATANAAESEQAAVQIIARARAERLSR